MADSEDEYDRKRRDKFRGERSAGDNYRAERRDERRREDWPERGRGRPEYRDYRAARDRYSPGRELPPPKRMRPEWGDERRYGGHEAYGMYGWGHEHYSMHGHPYTGHPQLTAHTRETQSNSDLQTQPPMLTLKQFLDTQDDGISDSEVLQKYSEYKLEFKRQQLNEFFVAHKDEEWFKNKYHPEESIKRKEEQLNFLKKRVEVFTELLEKGAITNVTVDTNQTDQLLRLLDTVVIKLEGGTEEDLKALDEKPPEYKPMETKFSEAKKEDNEQDDDVIITEVKSNARSNVEEENWDIIPSKIKNNVKAANDDEENWDSFEVEKPKKTYESVDGEENWDSFEAENTSKKQNDNRGENWDSFEMDKSTKDDKDDEAESWDTVQDKKFRQQSKDKDEEWGTFEVKKNKKLYNDDGEENWDSDGGSSEKPNISPKRKRSDSESSDSSANWNKSRERELSREKSGKSEFSENNDSMDKTDLVEDINNKQNNNKIVDNGRDYEEEITKRESPKEVEEKVLEMDEESTKEKTEEILDEKCSEVKLEAETIDLDKEKDPEESEGSVPRHLHRTSSIFLRNLAPTITKAEIEAVCKRYDGFLRVAIADPLVERRWFRRGWVTFKRDVNIKEICWNLNNIRLRDCEMGAIVNRDLSRRVRPVNGITAHKTIVRSDIKLCAKITLNLDEKFALWSEPSEIIAKPTNGESKKETFGFKSNNPVLQNITDFLIEEASAEEDELLGFSTENKDSTEGEILERDPQLISVLDKLILYLRIVHSVDFYNHCEYPYEDEMPNRCGIIHARGPPPQNKITCSDIQDYIKNFENKMSSFLAKSAAIQEEELKNLGCRDPEAEVEKFIQANTQELAKDKWLCPLSGKKFKGPEFIRKHIFNKHGEKVEEVRKEVEYFNNYLKDPKRPQLPEHPGNTRRQPADMGPQVAYRPGYPAPTYAPPYAAYAPPMIAPPRPRGYGNRRELPVEHQRRIIGYHDLDAPQNFDLFD